MLNSAQEPTGTAESPTDGTNQPPESRRLQRITLPLPARIDVKVDQNTAWDEITRLSDISAFGAGFMLKRPLKRGRMVQLTIPMPRQLRCFDYAEPQYRIWGLVRRCIETKSNAGENFAIGVAFTGKHPPAGYLEHPSLLYDVTHRVSENGFWHVEPADLLADDTALPKELRKQSRFAIPESITLELLDGDGNVSAYETTVTENISVGGAAAFTQHKLDPGTFIRVTSQRYSVTILSVVRGYRTGPDGIPRVHIEFIDSLFPLEGLD